MCFASGLGGGARGIECAKGHMRVYNPLKQAVFLCSPFANVATRWLEVCTRWLVVWLFNKAWLRWFRC